MPSPAIRTRKPSTVSWRRYISAMPASSSIITIVGRRSSLGDDADQAQAAGAAWG